MFTLQLLLEPYHFQEGLLVAKCVASMLTMHWQSSDVKIKEESPTLARYEKTDPFAMLNSVQNAFMLIRKIHCWKVIQLSVFIVCCDFETLHNSTYAVKTMKAKSYT